LTGICAGLTLLAAACFWTRVPANYAGSPDVPPLHDAKPQVSPSPSTPLAISMLQAHFQVNETGHQITWSVENTGKVPITKLYLSLFDQRYADRLIDVISVPVLPPGQFATRQCKWYTGPPTVRVDSATVENNPR
jgi:hypothetical protein